MSMLVEFDATAVRKFFGSSTFEKGQAYLKQNRVSKPGCSLVNNGTHVDALVQGSQELPYAVFIRATNRGKWQFTNTCACSLGGNCKHVVAALLHAIEAGSGQVERVINHDTPRGASALQKEKLEEIRRLAALHGIDLTHVSAQVAPAPVAGLPGGLKRWLDGVSAASGTQKTSPSQALLYQFEPTLGGRLRLSIFSSRVLKSGSFSGIKPYFSIQTAAFNPPSYFTSDDNQIAKLLTRVANANVTGSFANLEGSDGAQAMMFILETRRSFIGRADDIESARWLLSAKERPGAWAWQVADNGEQSLQLSTTPPASYILPTAPPYFVDAETGEAGEIHTNLSAKLTAALVQAPTVPAEHVATFARELAHISPEEIVPQPAALEVEDVIDVTPTPILWLYGGDAAPGYSQVRAQRFGAARIYFDYRGGRIAEHDNTRQVTRRELGRVLHIRRDTDHELNLQAQLRAKTALKSAHTVFNRWEAPSIDPYDYSLIGANPEWEWRDFQNEVLPKLRKLGWTIEIDTSFPFRFIEAQDWYGEIDDSSNHWFGVELGVMVDGEKINLLPVLLAALKADVTELSKVANGSISKFTVKLPDGRRLVLPADRVRPIVSALLEMAEHAALKDGKLILDNLRANTLAEFEAASPGLASRWLGGERILNIGRRLADIGSIPQAKPPRGLLADLREYQIQGLSWLQFLNEQGLGGILADDMGLGKTVQTLAHLQLEREKGRLNLPVLIIAPTSLISNWRRESAKFTPELKVLTLHGSERKSHYAEIDAADIVLTTYGLLRFDEDALVERQWHTVILDEAQHIKNAASVTARIAIKLKAQHRLSLTGTPLENHLGELWSQYQFLMPGLLGSDKDFKRLYRTPIEKQGDVDKRERLARRVSPFLLRRTKAQVATELPPKTEIVRSVALDGPQCDLYEAVRLSLNEKVRAEMKNMGLARSHILVLQALLNLRQVCCDPRLVKLDSAVAAHGSSAKLDMLMEMLISMAEEGRKILVFSQFTSMLKLIEKRLTESAIEYALLTGSTHDRDAEVQRFQSGAVPVFLLSLKAGGVGLNLTAADTVIHYDPWWNPAAENQASDRAYRIGQDKPVFVYKLLVEGSVEERIQALQARKAALFEGIVGDAEGELAGKLSENDIEELLKPLA